MLDEYEAQSGAFRQRLQQLGDSFKAAGRGADADIGSVAPLLTGSSAEAGFASEVDSPFGDWAEFRFLGAMSAH